MSTLYEIIRQPSVFQTINYEKILALYFSKYSIQSKSLKLAAISEFTQLHACFDLYFLLCSKFHHSNLVYMLLSLLLSFPFGDPKGIQEPPLVFHHFSQTVVLLQLLPIINSKDILTSYIHSCVVRCNIRPQLYKL